MKTTLKARVELFTVTLVAELAVLERRPELALVCQEAGPQGVLDARVVERVLPGLSATACENLRRHCEYLGLCDAAGRLTAVGRRCAERAEVPLPEQGVYTFWVARHPLCGERLLHVRREPLDPYDSDFQRLAPVPDWFRADRHQVSESVVDRELRFCVRELLGPSGQPVRGQVSTVLPAQLSWEVDFASGENHWQLTGQVEWREGEQLKRIPFATAPESVADLEALDLFAKWEPRWRAEQGFVAMNFDGQLGEPTAAFRRSLSYPSVTVPGRGTYERVEVREVPVGPVSTTEAQRWVDALLRSALKQESGYVPTPRLRALFDMQVQGTPLSLFPVVLAGVEDHLKALVSDERLYWMLAAPFDLRPEGAAP